eukprot:364192-Chlamydomonas_euryale.AAC.5
MAAAHAPHVHTLSACHTSGAAPQVCQPGAPVGAAAAVLPAAHLLSQRQAAGAWKLPGVGSRWGVKGGGGPAEAAGCGEQVGCERWRGASGAAAVPGTRGDACGDMQRLHALPCALDALPCALDALPCMVDALPCALDALPCVLDTLPCMMKLSDEQLRQVRETGWTREVAFKTAPGVTKLEIKGVLEAM